MRAPRQLLITFNGKDSKKVDFEFEIVVSDDGSTDKTPEILKQFSEKYPAKFKLILSPFCWGENDNFFKMLSACNGNYIALLAAADEWTFEGKLQSQIDFLEKNPAYAGCFHDANLEATPDADGKFPKSPILEFKYFSQFNSYAPDFGPWDLLERNIINMSSLVFVNRYYKSELKPYMDLALSISWILQLIIVKNKKFKYFNQKWAKYQLHSKRVDKVVTASESIRSNIAILKQLLKDEYYSKIKHHIYSSLASEFRSLFFTADDKFTFSQKVKILFNFFFYSELYTFSRTKTFFKELTS